MSVIRGEKNYSSTLIVRRHTSPSAVKPVDSQYQKKSDASEKSPLDVLSEYCYKCMKLIYVNFQLDWRKNIRSTD